MDILSEIRWVRDIFNKLKENNYRPTILHILKMCLKMKENKALFRSTETENALQEMLRKVLHAGRNRTPDWNVDLREEIKTTGNEIHKGKNNVFLLSNCSKRKLAVQSKNSSNTWCFDRIYKNKIHGHSSTNMLSRQGKTWKFLSHGSHSHRCGRLGNAGGRAPPQGWLWQISPTGWLVWAVTT